MAEESTVAYPMYKGRMAPESQAGPTTHEDMLSLDNSLCQVWGLCCPC
jgi:hypothetical protein